MAKFRKKPVVIEAEQFFQDLAQKYWPDSVEPLDSPWPNRICDHCKRPLRQHGAVETLEGVHIACNGDWIITGVKGEKYPCKPVIFEQTYEPVEIE